MYCYKYYWPFVFIQLIILILQEKATPVSSDSNIKVAYNLTEAQKAILLYDHVDDRNNVDPPAANMRLMTWNEDLAQESLEISRRCLYTHSGENSPTLGSVGENIFMSSTATERIDNSLFETSVYMWDYEKNHYDYETRRCDPGMVCGHYTAMVWADTYEVGCAMTVCHSVNVHGRSPFSPGNLVFCRYHTAPNIVGRHPYISGDKCSSCPSTDLCINGMCANPDRDGITDYTSYGGPASVERYEDNCDYNNAIVLTSGGNLHESGTFIRSVAAVWTGHYPEDQDITWDITAPSDKYIRLDFECHFNLQGTNESCIDFLNVTSDGFQQIFCGSTMPESVVINSSALNVKFHSDSTIQDLGFAILVTFYDIPTTTAATTEAMTTILPPLTTDAPADESTAEWESTLETDTEEIPIDIYFDDAKVEPEVVQDQEPTTTVTTTTAGATRPRLVSSTFLFSLGCVITYICSN
ncbi:uncharacterized protein LOC120329044 [Styela clava]